MYTYYRAQRPSAVLVHVHDAPVLGGRTDANRSFMYYFRTRIYTHYRALRRGLPASLQYTHSVLVQCSIVPCYKKLAIAIASKCNYEIRKHGS